MGDKSENGWLMSKYGRLISKSGQISQKIADNWPFLTSNSKFRLGFNQNCHDKTISFQVFGLKIWLKVNYDPIMFN